VVVHSSFENIVKRLTFRVAIAASVVTILSGCQSIHSLQAPGNQAVFTAPSYHGKELPSGFFKRAYSPAEDSGHQLRGYDTIGKRHWF